MISSKADIIAQACTALETGGPDAARDILCSGYPFQPQSRAGRKYTLTQCTRIFLRDGFIDRYSGERLVFPGALRVLSLVCPDTFPYHKNGKTDVGHFAWWELFPSIDHIVPITRGGADDESNWVTTSMLRNSAKQLWTLEELGWQLHPPGDLDQWDGQIHWFCRFMESTDHPHIDRTLQYLRDCHRAATSALDRKQAV
ncbi:MAG: HNH endonuclease [Candidatus Sumerlaeaceae bacterium]